jgi:hypothetical protein
MTGPPLSDLSDHEGVSPPEPLASQSDGEEGDNPEEPKWDGPQDSPSRPDETCRRPLAIEGR